MPAPDQMADAPTPDDPTTAAAHAEAATDDPAIAAHDEEPASRVGKRAPGDAGDLGTTDTMTAATGGLAGTSR